MTVEPVPDLDSRPSLTVQTVLYGNHAESVLRSAESLARSLDVAQQAGLVGQFALHIGDGSPTPVLGESHQDALAERFDALWGIVGVDFFNENLGTAAGHNRMLRKLETPYVVIANPDIVYAPDTLTALLRRFEPGIGVVEARQIPLEHPKSYDQRTGVTSWASTACVMLRTEVLQAIDGFDAETFFLYCDDVDMSWRARLAGYEVVFEPTARAFHDKRLDLDGVIEVSAAERYYSAEAALLLAHKYSRPDLVEKIKSDLRAAGEDVYHRAVDEYERRESEGRLPVAIDADHEVGQFVDGAYAVHRF